MSTYQLLLFPTLAAAILVLSGALKEKPVVPQPPLAVARTADNDPQALEILDQAIAALAPERVAWLETAVWQQVRCEYFVYQARGRLLTAPGDRSRFDLNIRVGKTVGELRMVNNGKTLFQSMRIAANEPVVKRWELPVASDKQTNTADVVHARAAMMEERGFTALSPMLHMLRHRVQSAQVRQQLWNGRTVYLVSAAWPLENVALIAQQPTEPVIRNGLPTGLIPPRFHVRQCCLYLDAETLWPHRVEWWGADRPHKPSQLLTQTEYRDPVLNQPLSPERCAAEFGDVER